MTGFARRNRTAPWLLVAGFAVVLSGCASEAGPTPDQQPVTDVSLENVSRKIELVQHDPCYEQPREHGTANCERYLVEVRNIANAAQEANTAPPEVMSAGRDLGQQVQELYGNQCLPPSDDNAQQCSDILVAIGESMDGLDEALPQ